METLKEEISIKCAFTVSIGSSRLIDDDLGMTDGWIERVENNLKLAQSRGKNQVCFGGGNHDNDNINERKNDNEIESKMIGTDDMDGIAIDGDFDDIENKSLQEIKVGITSMT